MNQVKKMLRSRFVDRSNSNYLKYGLHVFAENAVRKSSIISQCGTTESILK